MNQLRSSVMVNFSFALLFLSLLMQAAMAQQEVALSISTIPGAQLNPTGPSHTTKLPRGQRRAKRGRPFQQKQSQSRRRPRKHPDQSASREVIDRRVKQ